MTRIKFRYLNASVIVEVKGDAESCLGVVKCLVGYPEYLLGMEINTILTDEIGCEVMA